MKGVRKMQKVYNPINWENYPSLKTAVNETNLGAMDKAIDDIDTEVVQLDFSKANQSDFLSVVDDVDVDEDNGDITVYHVNGTTKVIHTNLNKIAVNFRFDKQTEILYLIMPDETETAIDLSSLISTFDFIDSDTISTEFLDGGKTVKFHVKDGSITESKLQPNFLADIKTEVSKAQTAQSVSEEKSLISEGWANGTQRNVPVTSGSPYFENNAKYWSQQAKSSVTVIPTTTRTDITVPGDYSVDATMANPSVPGSFANVLTSAISDIEKLKRTTIIILKDVTISRMNFEDDNTYDDFPYKGTVSVEALKNGSYVPDVAFSLDDAMSGNYAPIAECENGNISIYAKKMPDDIQVIIPSVVCTKVVE